MTPTLPAITVVVLDWNGREFCAWLESPDAVLSAGIPLFRYMEAGEVVLAQHHA